MLSGRHGTQLNREYHYDRRGQLTQIDAGTETLSYHYDAAGRLSEAQTAFYHHQYHYDPAGNRLSALPPRPVVAYPDDLPVDTRYDRGNRLTEDEHWHYRYDSRGNLIQKNHKRNAGEVHDYVWDGGNRLVQYRHTSGWSEGRHVRQGRYLYDPLGRRVGKQTRHTRAHGQDDEDSTQTHWYGWGGDNLVLTERDGQRIHTVYPPGSFVPLLRIEAPVLPPVTPLADRLEQASGLRFPDELKARFHQTEQALRQGELSEGERQWLADIAFTPERLLALLDPLPERELLVHLYHCNHLGTPLALLNQQGEADWQAELDGWGSVVSEHNPQRLYQPVRMQGQQYDEESGLHYNRHRYYDPGTGRYISQDPIGLSGGINMYIYALNPMKYIDPLGLFELYGNWCGPNWTGGHEKPWDKLTPLEKSSALPPIDATDACCEIHDKCHAKAREVSPCSAPNQERLLKKCDRELSSCIWNNTNYFERVGRPNIIKNFMLFSMPSAELNCPAVTPPPNINIVNLFSGW